MVQSQDRSYTHTGCANCLKPLEADLTWIVQCPTCKTECEVQLIVRVVVQIHDRTATIKTTLTLPIIEKFITITSSQIKNAEEAGENINDIVQKELNGQTIIAFARAYETTYQQQPAKRIFIVNAHKTQIKEAENPCTQLKANPKKRKAVDTSTQLKANPKKRKTQ